MRNLSSSGRGALIVFEGCDRAGKTTQVQNIVKYLNDSAGKPEAAKMMRFPDRTTQAQSHNALIFYTRDLPGKCSGLNYVYSMGEALIKKARRKNLAIKWT